MFKQTEIGMIPEDWETKFVSELSLRVTKGTTPTTLGRKFVKRGINFIKVEALNDDGSIDNTKFMFIDEQTNDILSRSKLEIKDILYSIAGTIGRVSIVNQNILPANTNQAIAIIKPDLKKIDLQYFRYALVNPQIKNYLLSKVVHAVQANLSLTEISNCPIPYASRQEQSTIAKILSDLDSKIELNQQMNKTLEAIGQAIFRHWFIDFEFPNEQGKPYKSLGGEMVFNEELGKEIPKGWRVSKIGQELKTVLGGTPSTTNKLYWENGNIAWINSGKINEFRIIEPSAYITKEAVENSATKLLPKGTTVLAITGATLGQVSRIEIDTCANQSVIGIIQSEIIPSIYIYYTIKYYINKIIRQQTGGAQQHINKDNVDKSEMLVPAEKIIKQFYLLTKPLFSNISSLCFESKTLSQIRNSLLPKLMSGKIRVSIVDKTEKIK